MQWVVRDRFAALAVLYYALAPGLVFLFGIAAAAANRGRLRRVALATCLVAAAWWLQCSVAWVGVARRPPSISAPSGAGSADGPTTRLLLWNVARGVRGWDAIANYVRDLDTDLVVLVEADRRDGSQLDFWRRTLTGHSVASAGEGLIVAAKGTLRRRMRRHLAAGCVVAVFDVSLPGAALQLVAVDIKSRPTFDRGPALTALADLVAGLQYRGAPVVVAGDFNTPPGSVHLLPLRQHLRNAAESAGIGWIDTWPQPVPLLCLDQVWLDPRLWAVQRLAAWTPLSDHRPVLVTFRFAPSTNGHHASRGGPSYRRTPNEGPAGCRHLAGRNACDTHPSHRAARDPL